MSTKKIKITFSNSNKVVLATLLEQEQPQLVKEIWELLKVPMRGYAHNTLSTGDMMECRPVAPYHPVEFGNQSNPLGGKTPMLCELKNGNIFWAGWYFGFVYGKCTEPMVAMGPNVAKVDPEYLEDFHEAGQDMWNHVYLYHKLGTIVVERGDEG